MAGWIGVDFDGTLSVHGVGPGLDGAPIVPMVQRVLDWHLKGIEVRVVSARGGYEEGQAQIADWLEKNGLPPLKVTDKKDFGMIELWDDRAVAVEPNTGRVLGGA